MVRPPKKSNFANPPTPNVKKSLFMCVCIRVYVYVYVYVGKCVPSRGTGKWRGREGAKPCKRLEPFRFDSYELVLVFGVELLCRQSNCGGEGVEGASLRCRTNYQKII
jgi:hypothetical protein